VIHFDKLSYKNILSTGNAWTEIDLAANKSTLIVGENGAGKSTMLDAICFALYGKPFRKINKPQLMNSINQKDLKVKVEFTTSGHKYIVLRGMKPAIFEIWRDGELLNQDAAARDYQAYLEENILKLNFKSFGQVVVLGSSTFVPFMQLPAKSRRDVIEDLLDIQIFTVMNTLLKEKISANKDNVAEIKYQIDLLKNKIESAKNHNESIRKIKETEVSRIKDRVKEQLTIIEAEEKNIESVSSVMDNLTAQIGDKASEKKKLEELGKIDDKLDTKMRQIMKEVKFYENHDNCPTCKQGIEHTFKEDTKSSHLEKVKEIELAKEQIVERKSKHINRLNVVSDIADEISAHHLRYSEHRANVKFAKNTLSSIRTELEDAQKEFESIDTSTINNLESDLKSYHANQTELFDSRETLSLVSSMLKDGGIKTRIIKQYIPIMNKLINKYLAAMDFFVQFELDESFNETIKSRFRDEFSYASFSEGEKLRIDLALLFTWRAVAKLRNSVSTNLLIMDEIMDSSLDNTGTEEFLKIINELTADSNIFIISHKGDQLYDKFDNVIRFEKVKNFSRMAT